MRPQRLLPSFLVILVTVCWASDSRAQESSLGEGCVLVAPIADQNAYLINAKKEIVHTWPCGGGAGNATYLLKDGSLLRTGKIPNQVFNARGGPGGSIKKIAWDGTLLWDYTVSDETKLAHHDVEPMPNGNILVIAWEYRSRADAIAAGRDPKTLADDALWPEMILEINPVGKTDGEVVWEWRLWDHLIQQFDDSKSNYGSVPDHPELVDINYGVRRGGSDWIHMNSIDYNAELDQIALSARWFDEVWIIDHSTTKQESAGHTGGNCSKGGDLVYRWGNPESYFGGFPADRQLFAQHDARWIDNGLPGAGNLLLFNNGDPRSGRAHSSVDELVPPLKEDGTYELSKTAAFAPKAFVWSYSDPDKFASERISGAQRLPSGNTLICSGQNGWVFEVTPEGQRVWEFQLSELGTDGRRGGGLFRAPYYKADFSALLKN
jgi:hypothetical protein